MDINRFAIKSNAKFSIGRSKPNAVLVALVYMIIAVVLRLLANAVSNWQGYLDFIYDGISEFGRMYPVGPFEIMSAPGTVIALALLIMEYMVSVGFIIYMLNIVRMRKASFGNLFDGFGLFFKVIWLAVLTEIFVFLWSLLFIIPGIIAAYRYRQAIYILLDNPGMSALECIRASKKMMRRHKGELFVLDLSFIGWYIFSIIPFVAVWVMPYTGFTFVYYYEALRGPDPDDAVALPGADSDDGDSRGRPPWEY
ncbi:MAG: DUF975 family protein [Oscillospiraceae bacterium]|nr:DUF975 family protein [Oscillospiraceae bacterium]